MQLIPEHEQLLERARSSMRSSLVERLFPEDLRKILDFQKKPGSKIIPLIEAFGIKIDLKPLPNEYSGSLEYSPDCGSKTGYRIVVNTTHSRARQRFTAAHELGHYLLHRREDFFAESFTTNRMGGAVFLTDDDDLEENEADGFAANLLVPFDEFERILVQGRASYAEAAGLFNVSIEVIRRRSDEFWRRRL